MKRRDRMNELTNIGYIASFHGVKGEVKIKSTTDFNDERYKVGNIVYLCKGKDMVEKKIASVRQHKGMILLTFEGVTNLNEVEKYKGYEVKVSSENKVDLKEDEFLYSDLKGMNVVNHEGDIIGSVETVMDNPAQPILVCLIDKAEVLIPFTKVHVPKVDKENNNLYLSDIDGLY